MQVLGLDESIKPAVLKMRRNLLKLLNVGEFDPWATWQDPCISFTLPEVPVVLFIPVVVFFSSIS